MPQTKFVLAKAICLSKIKQGLMMKPLLFICNFFANEEQLDFPVLYASGRSGWASKDMDGSKEKNLHPIIRFSYRTC